MEDAPSDSITFRPVHLTVAPFIFQPPDNVPKDTAATHLRRRPGVWHGDRISACFDL